MQVYSLMEVLVTFIVINFIGLLVYFYNVLVRKPGRLRSILAKQGITGPKPTLLLGNILEMKKLKAAVGRSIAVIGGAPTVHNCGPITFPFFTTWQKEYGEVFAFSLGTTQVLYTTQPDMIRDMTRCTSLDLGKPLYQARDRSSLLGQGILTSNGPSWTHQRKTIAPELYMDKVKGMINILSESTMTLVKSWKDLINESESEFADIKIDKHLRSLSSDVISKACFGSNYVKGEKIFSKLKGLQEIASKNKWATAVPWMRYIPTKNNRKEWALEKDIKSLILNEVKERKKIEHEKDLFQMVLEGAENNDLTPDSIDKFIVDNCKNIYFAGFETTAISASWCLMLLASNPLWQERIRSEVQEICNGQFPDYEMIIKMKQLSMVINETLRLYPPGPIISREVFKDMKFGKIYVPKGLNLWANLLTLHTDTKIWGADAYEFNPSRFVNGVKGACKEPHLYMPFGMGPRVCVGQNLALLELKVLIALLVSNLSFTLSPSYVHSPTMTLAIEPSYGVKLQVKKL